MQQYSTAHSTYKMALYLSHAQLKCLYNLLYENCKMTAFCLSVSTSTPLVCKTQLGHMYTIHTANGMYPVCTSTLLFSLAQTVQKLLHTAIGTITELNSFTAKLQATLLRALTHRTRLCRQSGICICTYKK